MELAISLTIKIVKTVLALLLVLLGMVGWFLPLVPGWPMVFLGLALAATEFEWAERLRERIWRRFRVWKEKVRLASRDSSDQDQNS